MTSTSSSAFPGKPGPERFSAMFRTGEIGNLRLKNRLIMPAMGNALAGSSGMVTEAMVDYYAARAGGGVGMVITQFASVTGEDAMPYSLAVYDDKFIPGLERLTGAVHAAGARACIQLMHPGLLFLLLPSIPAGVSIKVPGLSPRLPAGKPYRELSRDDIRKLVKDFGTAAVRARKAGADAVEIHACHGCLVSSFLSPAINRREDEYGGNPENRARLACEIAEEVRREAGNDLPVIVRINGLDDVDGGVNLEEVVRQAAALEQSGASAISISSGIEFWSTLMAPSYLVPGGIAVPAAERVKAAVKVPVIVAGKVRPEPAADIIEKGKADFIAWGRPLLANPGLPEGLLRDGAATMPQCIYCNNCIVSNWRLPNSCTVNPFLYREANGRLEPSPAPKKVMVVGGGLAGMWSALICRKRGHTVKIYEKSRRLGGQWNTACALPGKQGYASLLDCLKGSLEKLKVPVELGREVTRETVAAENPDAVVLATGAVPVGLDVPGGSLPHVVQANDVIEGRAGTGKRAVVIGGRILGLETALMLAEKGVEVSLVSRSGLGGRRGPDDKIAFRALVRRLIEMRIPVYLNAPVLEVTGNSVIISLGDEPVSLPADTVVLAIGVRPEDAMAGELKGLGVEVYTAGDCVQPGNAAQAAFSAARWALRM